MPRLRNEKLIEKNDLKKIGRVVGGTHWQADIAREMDYSKSMVARAVGGTRTPDEDFLKSFRLAMINRIANIASLLDVDGLPFAEEPKTARAMTLIKDGVLLLLTQHKDLPGKVVQLPKPKPKTTNVKSKGVASKTPKTKAA